MAPGKNMDSLVAEIAIVSLRGPELRPKKRIMPLRIATYFQNNCFTTSDIHKQFDNNSQWLNRCESISFPTLEILDKEKPKESGHYWALVLNIRDKRFEALDSSRHDYSIYMIYNTKNSNDTHVLKYGPKDILKFRKILTADMVRSNHNDINWARMLHIKKRG